MSQEALVVDGPLGRVELTGSALASLVVCSAEAVEHVHVRRSRRRPSISVTADEVRIELSVEAPVGARLVQIGALLQRTVAGSVSCSTGLPTRVDVTFETVS
jgi:hypothetical protein